jgi:hypothetical protein
VRRGRHLIAGLGDVLLSADRDQLNAAEERERAWAPFRAPFTAELTNTSAIRSSVKRDAGGISTP